jgi:cobaltochelatase CobT
MTEGAERVGAALQLVLTVALVAFLFWGAFRKRRRGKPVKDGPEDEPYKVFTKGWDQELEARLVPEMLRSISPDFAKGYLQISRDAWNIRIQRARDMLANAPAIDMKIGLPSQLATALKASCVVLLVDQSGSMKGDPILDTAVAVRRVADGLSAAGATFEVLGFSTLGWQGGFAEKAGAPLCASAHRLQIDGRSGAK